MMTIAIKEPGIFFVSLGLNVMIRILMIPITNAQGLTVSNAPKDVYKRQMLLFLSISCNKGEDISFEETPYYLGYFEGKVNSQDISIANQSNSHSFIDHGNFWQEVNTDLSGFYWEIPLGVHISDYPYPMLRISLIPLREGEYPVSYTHLRQC